MRSQRKIDLPDLLPDRARGGQRLRPEATHLQDQRHRPRLAAGRRARSPTSGSSRVRTLGEYYGFMATKWKDPPILDNPSEEREIGDRTYKLYYDGRQAADRRLAGRQRLVLGLEHADPVALRARDDRDRPRHARAPEAGRQVVPPPRPRRLRSCPRERTRADRRRRARLGRPGHRRLLRRARPPRGRPRDRRRQGRGAERRASCPSSSRTWPRWSSATPSGSSSPPSWRAAALDAGCAFICVGTPPTHSGDADLSAPSSRRSTSSPARAGRRW